ncbi:MAG: hypothetical protein AAGA90_05485 [Actinomycetota bacterium]
MRENESAYERTRTLLEDAIDTSDDGVSFPIPDPPNKYFVPITLGVAFVGFVVIFLIMYATGVLDAPSDEVDAQTLGAALVLLGALLSEAIVVVGLLIGHNEDTRQYRLAVYEQARLRQQARNEHAQKLVDLARQATDSELASEQKEIEARRLHHETAIKALELLASRQDLPTSRVQSAVVFALIGMGLRGAAIGILREAWFDQSAPMDSTVAVAAIDRLLVEGQMSTSEFSNVVFLLADKGQDLVEAKGNGLGTVHFPRALLEPWPAEMSDVDERHLLLVLDSVLGGIATKQLYPYDLAEPMLDSLWAQRERAWRDPQNVHYWNVLGAIVAACPHLQYSEDYREKAALFNHDRDTIRAIGGDLERSLDWFERNPDPEVAPEPEA